MEIKQDPVTMLWARSDGALLMPPNGRGFRKFRWTFGYLRRDGYRTVRYKGKQHQVHRIVCRAFHGLPPADKPEVDHIDHQPANNREDNLRWADRSLNSTNRVWVDKAPEKYGARSCGGERAYHKARYESYGRARYAAHRAKMKAQGLVQRKGPDGRYHWYPKINTTKQEEAK